MPHSAEGDAKSFELRSFRHDLNMVVEDEGEGTLTQRPMTVAEIAAKAPAAWIQDHIRMLADQAALSYILCHKKIAEAIEAAIGAVLAERGQAAAPELAGTKPVVLFFGSDVDRDEFMALIAEAKPGMVARKVP